MYQYYHLNKKAYEIIANAPDILTNKINNIMEYFNRGAYDVQS